LNEWIRKLSGRAEFVLLVSLSFAYFIATSFATLILRIREYELTTGRQLGL
jgi:hypothetical protein